MTLEKTDSKGAKVVGCMILASIAALSFTAGFIIAMFMLRFL